MWKHCGFYMFYGCYWIAFRDKHLMWSIVLCMTINLVQNDLFWFYKSVNFCSLLLIRLIFEVSRLCVLFFSIVYNSHQIIGNKWYLVRFIVHSAVAYDEVISIQLVLCCIVALILSSTSYWFNHIHIFRFSLTTHAAPHSSYWPLPISHYKHRFR